MGSRLALKLVDQTSANQKATIRSSGQHKRAIDAFGKGAGSVTTAAEFVKNYDVYTFTMRAFNLEDQIFGKALIRKILESDITKPNALINRLTDPRFRELYKALNFTTTATGARQSSLTTAAFQTTTVDKYVTRMFINEETKVNPTVGNVLDFREKVAGIKTWYDVLKDANLTKFVKTALGLPSSLSGLAIDKQITILSKKFDITKMANPVETNKLIGKYLLFSDMNGGNQFAASNAILQLFQPANSGGYFMFQSIDIPVLPYSGFKPYG